LNDISFFLDALEETQIKSRIERDVKKRGYTLEEALALFHNVKPDYERFIAPTKNSASVIFQVGPDYIMHPIQIHPKFK
jgi:uridine kinase